MSTWTLSISFGLALTPEQIKIHKALSATVLVLVILYQLVATLLDRIHFNSNLLPIHSGQNRQNWSQFSLKSICDALSKKLKLFCFSAKERHTFCQYKFALKFMSPLSRQTEEFDFLTECAKIWQSKIKLLFEEMQVINFKIINDNLHLWASIRWISVHMH